MLLSGTNCDDQQQHGAALLRTFDAAESDRLHTIEPLSAAQAADLVSQALTDTERARGRIVTIDRYEAWGQHTAIAEAIVEVDDIATAFVVTPDGTRTATQAFWQTEKAARRARTGALSYALWQELPTLRETDAHIPVTITVRVSAPEPSLPTDATDHSTVAFERWTQTHATYVARLVDEQVAAIAARLRTSGLEDLDVYHGVPVLEGTLSAAQLERLAQDDTIEEIAKTDTSPARLNADHAGHLSMGITAPLTPTTPLRSLFYGGPNCAGACNGASMTVGIWEWDPVATVASIHGGIARNNARLTGFTGPHAIIYQRPLSSCTTTSDCTITGAPISQQHVCALQPDGTSKCVQDHMSYVAASVGMNGLPYKFDTLFPGNTPDPAPNATNAFEASGAYNVRQRVANTPNDHTGSLSFLVAPSDGTPPAVYINRSVAGAPNVIDWAGRHYGSFVTLAGGNTGQNTVVDCGTLRNILCVGWYAYQTWNSSTTHKVALANSTANPPAIPNLERPHLLGPGTHTENSGMHVPLITQTSGGSTMAWAGLPSPGNPNPPIQGSSFAAPAVLGLALQAHQYEGLLSALAFPMVTKAVLLASASDLLTAAGTAGDGPIGKTNVWSPQPSDANDGAGRIEAAYTKQILDNNQYYTNALTNANFIACGANCREVTIANVTLAPYQYLRAALAWQSCMNTINATPVMDNDFDLIAIRTSGTAFEACAQTRQSNSTVSETEMLEVGNCPTTRTYSLRVRIKNGATLTACDTAPGATATERIGVAWSVRNP